MKKFVSFILLLSVLLINGTGLSESGEWTCTECGNVNTGNFCVSCGTPRVSPTPIPTAEPTPAPTPEPEVWKCRYCKGVNSKTSAFCRYCGSAKPDSGKEHADNPVAELYKGMSREDVIRSCGGKEITSFKYDFLDLHVDFKYDEYEKLKSVTLNINSSYISFENFVFMIRRDYGADNWSSLRDLGFARVTTKEYDDARWTIMCTDLGSMYMSTWIIEPLVSWDNVRMGRETVQREAAEANESAASDALLNMPELAPYRNDHPVPLSSFVFHAGVTFGMSKEEIRTAEKAAGFELVDRKGFTYPYVSGEGIYGNSSATLGFYVDKNGTGSSNDSLWKIVLSEGGTTEEEAGRFFGESMTALEAQYGAPLFTQEDSEMLKPQQLIKAMKFEDRGTYAQWVIPLEDNGIVSIVNSKFETGGNWFHMLHYVWVKGETMDKYIAAYAQKKK